MHASVDEQTIGFHGRHAHILQGRRGWLPGRTAEQGFTYAVHFRHEPPLLPSTLCKALFMQRVLWLFDHLMDNYHRIWMDNLYLSAKFCKAAYNHERKVLIAGVTRRNGRGLPLSSVLQEEEKNKNKQEAVRGTVKVSVLKGDPVTPIVLEWWLLLFMTPSQF